MRIKKIHQKLSLLILFIFLCSLLLPVSAFAQSDIKGHWAEKQISEWVKKGLAGGYADGTFKPDNEISRAEFVALINRAFGITGGGTAANYTDVKPDAWYYHEVAAAQAAGYISGYNDGTFRPKQSISRQEAACIVTNLLALDKDSKQNTFTDSEKIAVWAADSVNAVAAAGIMGGFSDGSFKPADPITRAQTVVTLDRALSMKPAAVSTVSFDKAGTYGPATGSETIRGNVVINVADVTLQNTVITGNLLLAAGIGDGDVTLKNVSVKGTTTVEGGGSESIVLEDCTLPSITVSKEGVRVVASGNTTVNVVTLESGATLVEVTISGPGFETVTISKVVPAGAQITLSGDFNAVTVAAEGAQVEIASGSVETLILDAKVEVTGEGKVETAKINADGATIAQTPASTEIKEGISASVGGETVTGTPSTSTPPSTPPAGGGGGDDDGGDSTVAVSAISITGDAVVGKPLTAALTPAGATVTYQWMRCDTVDGTYENIDGATSSIYTLADADAGKYIKVTATGTGNYIGTVTSSATAAVVGILATPIDYEAPGGLLGKSNTVALFGTTFEEEAENLDNWEIDTGTTNLEVDSITRTVGNDGVTIDYTLKVDGQGTGEGTITIKAKAAAVAAGVDTNEVSVVIEADRTAPVLSGPMVFNLLQESVTLSYMTNEAGHYYCVIYEAEDTAPANNEAVKAMSGGVVGSEGAFDTPGQRSIIITSGLTAATAYKAYIVVEDEAGNLSEILTIEFTTLEPADADQAAVDAEVAKYEAAATITSDVVVGADVTATVAKLIDGQAAGAGITLSYAVDPGTYLEVVDGGAVKVKAQKADEGDGTETVTITFTKNGKTATKDVTVTIKTSYVAPTIVNALALDSLVTAPVKDAAPDTIAIEEDQYTGTIAWFESDETTPVAGNFAASKVYVAKVTLTAKAGYTFTGVEANSFTYTGATTVTNAADSGVVTITFPATEE